jgi:hypothetical protein
MKGRMLSCFTPEARQNSAIQSSTHSPPATMVVCTDVAMPAASMRRRWRACKIEGGAAHDGIVLRLVAMQAHLDARRRCTHRANQRFGQGDAVGW